MTMNLFVQIVLIIAVFGSVYLARRKTITLATHCTIINAAVWVQIAAILLVMLPSLLGTIANVPSQPFFYPEELIHHSFGLILIGLWVYISLGIRNRVKMPHNRAAVMWLALGVWTVSLILGLHIYLTMPS